ncbi:hypothetical protein BG004_005043 [Podila humilis]|nr:hypothetical protein BG004_005043 [Podila humilis]
MSKSLVLLLSVVLVSVKAWREFELRLYEVPGAQHDGLAYLCSQHEYQQCYSTDKGKYRGLRSAVFETFNGRKQHYSVTLYSNTNCNGNFDRWSFSRGIGQPFSIDSFPTVSGNIRSFKIDNFHTSTTSGLEETYVDAVENSCENEFRRTRLALQLNSV